MYEIYKITSPSGRSYIGLTSVGHEERWRTHKRYARKYPNKRHPFYDAIRKYGEDNFSVSVLASCETSEQACALEKKFIAEEERPYNVSPGGEDDGKFGGKIFWERINADPEARDAYIKKLSDAKRANDHTDYELLQRKAREWREYNPRKAYYISRRNIRIANRFLREQREQAGGVKKEEPVRDLEFALTMKWKRADICRELAWRQWANKTEKEKREIFSKISEKQKAYWETITDQEERSKKTEKARNSINREKQGKAASQGIKRFWEELRKYPVAYEHYISKRRETLKRTLEEKKCERMIS